MNVGADINAAVKNVSPQKSYDNDAATCSAIQSTCWTSKLAREISKRSARRLAAVQFVIFMIGAAMDKPDAFVDYLNAFVTLLVGLGAYAVYWIQKHHERQNAARIVVADVRHAEQVIFTLLERNQVDVWTKDVIREDNWSRYKHLFVQHLSADDLASFNRFFAAGAQMSDALRRMREVLYAGIDEKARIAQQELSAVPLEPFEEYQRRAAEIMGRINRSAPMFEPDEPRSRFFVNLNQMGRLTNTPGFNALKRLAKE